MKQKWTIPNIQQFVYITRKDNPNGDPCEASLSTTDILKVKHPKRCFACFACKSSRMQQKTVPLCLGEMDKKQKEG